jgi:hypothetical protein
VEGALQLSINVNKLEQVDGNTASWKNTNTGETLVWHKSDAAEEVQSTAAADDERARRAADEEKEQAVAAATTAAPPAPKAVPAAVAAPSGGRGGLLDALRQNNKTKLKKASDRPAAAPKPKPASKAPVSIDAAAAYAHILYQPLPIFCPDSSFAAAYHGRRDA